MLGLSSPSFHQRNIALDVVDVPDVRTSVQRFGDDQHMAVQLEAGVECAAKVLGQTQPIGVLEIVGVDDLEEHIVADDFRCGDSIVGVQIVGYIHNGNGCRTVSESLSHHSEEHGLTTGVCQVGKRAQDQEDLRERISEAQLHCFGFSLVSEEGSVFDFFI